MSVISPSRARRTSSHTAFDAARARSAVAAACRSHGKILGVGGIRGDLELQSDLVKMGARFIIAGSDVTYLMAAARKDAETLRAIKVG